MRPFKFFHLLLIFSLLLSGARGQVRNELNDLYRSAYDAYQMYDYQTALDCYKKALDLIPGHPYMVYNMGCMYALLGNHESALEWLNRAVDMGFGYEMASDEDFSELRETKEFQEIVKKIEIKRKPTQNSKVVFRIKEKDLMPEGIAFDPVEKAFYISSVYKCKIIKIDQHGSIGDFTQEHQDGLRAVLGMKVDKERRILWVASGVNSPRMKGFAEEELGWSCIFKYDLKSGQLIRKYVLYENGIRHQLNDLVLTKEGDLYITDSAAGSVYFIPTKNDELELFLQADDFIYLNGITFSPYEKKLYVADSQSRIFIIDVLSKGIKGILHPDHITTFGIDGLYYHDQCLVAVQNGLNRIVRLYLDETGERIKDIGIIESNHPMFNIPTTAVIVEGKLYYMANTQLQSFNQDDSIFPMEQLQEIIIMQCSL